jgi:phage tail protein X
MMYRTKDGDVLDTLCLIQYGPRTGTTEAVLSANPGLGVRGPVYPSGILITFPDLPSAANDTATIRLWD